MDKELIYHGIDKMEQMGATGAGIKILVLENPSKDHSLNVAAAVRWVAPEVEVIRDSIDHRELPAYCREQGIDIINISQATSFISEERNAAYRQFVQDGGILFCAAGNWTDQGPFGVGKEVGIMVGAGTIRSDGKAYRDSYSGIHEEMDFMFLSDKRKMNNGTSFTAPMAAAWAARLLSLKRFTQPEIYQIMMDMAEPLADDTITGWDKFQGWGAPRFDPEKIAKYLEEEDMAKVIEMWIGRQGYLVDGESKIMDVPPVITNGRTLVPIRAVAEAFGAQVDYEPGTQKITITMGE